MMSNFFAKFKSGLCCADVESTIDLTRIGRNDLASKHVRQSDAERGLAGRRRAKDDERVIRGL